MVAVLLSQGAQANTSAQDGKTPLLAACAEGHLGVVQMLLPHIEGRALDVPNHYGDTALHLAAAEGYGEVIRVLLLAGADPSMTDNKGLMPRVLWRMDEERRAQEDVFQVCTCMGTGESTVCHAAMSTYIPSRSAVVVVCGNIRLLLMVGGYVYDYMNNQTCNDLSPRHTCRMWRWNAPNEVQSYIFQIWYCFCVFVTVVGRPAAASLPPIPRQVPP